MAHSQTSLEQIRIVLVSPAGAANLGSVARVMKNFGLDQLWLVAPRCSPDDEDARRMAVHAGDVLDTAVSTPDLRSALADCGRILGTTVRERTVSDPALDGSTGARWLLDRIPVNPSAYVFGPEDRGLSNEELALCHRHLRIPTSSLYPSLNLAQAVAICAYELFCSAPTQNPATADRPTSLQLEGFYEHLERTLLEIGYLQEHTATRKLEKFRRLFNRAELSSEEIALLRGILRQATWASRQSTGERAN